MRSPVFMRPLASISIPVMAAYWATYSLMPSAKALNLHMSRESEMACRSWKIFRSFPFPSQARGSVFSGTPRTSLAGVSPLGGRRLGWKSESYAHALQASRIVRGYGLPSPGLLSLRRRTSWLLSSSLLQACLLTPSLLTVL